MIRKATKEDIIPVAELYNEMLDYEEKNEKYTSWQKDIYPTVQTARLGVKKGSLYVYESNEKILASVILDTIQPPEYENVRWSTAASYDKALVIHTLCVHPKYSGSGIGSDIVDFAKQLALKKACLSIRLNTTEQNLPARYLYEKKGFTVIATQRIMLDGLIPCSNHLFMEYKL